MRYAQLSVVYLVNNPEPVQYVIYALAVPFDLRCESGTLEIITDLLYMWLDFRKLYQITHWK